MNLFSKVIVASILSFTFAPSVSFCKERPSNAREIISHDNPEAVFEAQMDMKSMQEEIRCYVEELKLSRQESFAMLFRTHSGIGFQFEETPRRIYRYVKMPHGFYKLNPQIDSSGRLVGLSAGQVDSCPLPEELITIIEKDENGHSSVRGFFYIKGITFYEAAYSVSNDWAITCENLADYRPKAASLFGSYCWWVPSSLPSYAKSFHLKDSFVDELFSKLQSKNSAVEQNDAVAGSLETRLTQLKKLKEDGLINEQEYENQRTRIIREL